MLIFCNLLFFVLLEVLKSFNFFFKTNFKSTVNIYLTLHDPLCHYCFLYNKFQCKYLLNFRRSNLFFFNIFTEVLILQLGSFKVISYAKTNIYPQPLPTNIYLQPLPTNIYPQPLPTNIYPQPLLTNIYLQPLPTFIFWNIYIALPFKMSIKEMKVEKNAFIFFSSS